jgi:class 3 adenylate cyclase
VKRAIARRRGHRYEELLETVLIRHRPLRRRVEPGRVLATVLFVDIVRSTEKAALLGDRRWNQVLSHYYAALRRELRASRGREVTTTGDGMLATFRQPGAARAIRCAAAMRQAVRTLGLEIRAGLHAGECELVGEAVGGIAVHIGARVMAKAGADEVLVSSTVKDLVVGSAIKFRDRGAHRLRGVPEKWRLYRVL